MEQFDAEKARRVWSRVQGRQQLPDCSEILSIKAQTASLYSRLSRYFRGKTGMLLQRFARQEQAHIRMLSSLGGGNSPDSYTPRKAPAYSLLRQCYSYKLQLLQLYEKFCNTPLADSIQTIIGDEQEQCQFLLQLLEKKAP